MNQSQSLTILLVEDDPGHARLIEKNLKRSKIGGSIVVLEDGKKAIDYIFGMSEDKDSKRCSPFLILLDLNLPFIDGYQILEIMKGNESTKWIPVIVFTTADNSQEIKKCYELGCNVYMSKPTDYEKFCQAIMNLGEFLSVIKLPAGE